MLGGRPGCLWKKKGEKVLERRKILLGTAADGFSPLIPSQYVSIGRDGIEFLGGGREMGKMEGRRP